MAARVRFSALQLFNNSVFISPSLARKERAENFGAAAAAAGSKLDILMPTSALALLSTQGLDQDCLVCHSCQS